MQKLKALWNSLPDGVKRVLHTAWQAGLSVLVMHLLLAHSTADVRDAFTVAGAAFLAALKAALTR
jgi:hypothetical protein